MGCNDQNHIVNTSTKRYEDTAQLKSVKENQNAVADMNPPTSNVSVEYDSPVIARVIITMTADEACELRYLLAIHANYVTIPPRILDLLTTLRSLTL